MSKGVEQVREPKSQLCRVWRPYIHSIPEHSGKIFHLGLSGHFEGRFEDLFALAARF